MEAELSIHFSVQVEFVRFRTKSGSDLPSRTVLLRKKPRESQKAMLEILPLASACRTSGARHLAKGWGGQPWEAWLCRVPTKELKQWSPEKRSVTTILRSSEGDDWQVGMLASYCAWNPSGARSSMMNPAAGLKRHTLSTHKPAALQETETAIM